MYNNNELVLKVFGVIDALIIVRIIVFDSPTFLDFSVLDLADNV